MDTDDLSRETYDGILIEAEKLTHDFTLHFGVLSDECKNETDYIDKTEKMTRAILKTDDWKIEDLFWGNAPERKDLQYTCNKILENIEQIRSIPIEKRKFDF